jgi:glycosidase
MENENFAASKPNEPLMSQNNQGQLPQQHLVKTPVVAVVEEDETKKKFLPQIDGDGAHYKKDFGQVEIKQAPKFIGLTQEELARYADDPFWRRLRIALFVLFWISWILMFVIAIILVVTSPKCPPKPQRQWWQKQLCSQTYVRSFKDGNGDGVGDFKGMKEKLYDVSRSHVQTIWPVPVIESKNFTGYDVTNFTAVDSRLGQDDFFDLVKKAHELQMFVIIDLPLTTMSTESYWFNESSSRSDKDYARHFYWNPVLPAGKEDEWKFNGKRNEYYRVDKTTGWPVLNWNSPDVQKDMETVLRTWLDRGIDGFYMGNVHLLGLDSFGMDIPDADGRREKIAGHIRGLRTIVGVFKNETGKEIALFTSLSKDEIEHDEAKNILIGNDGLDYVINTELTDVDDKCDAKCIRDKLVKTHEYHGTNNQSWPVWEIGNPYVDRLASRFGGRRDKAELFQMLLFMLEGSINTYYGDELGMVNADVSKITLDKPEKYVMRSPMQWDDSKNAGFSDSDTISIPVNADYASNNMKEAMTKASAAKLYRKMAEWRMNDEAFLFEKMEIAPPHDSIVAIKRKAYYSSPNYFAFMNFNNDTLTDINLMDLLNVTLPASAEPTVGIMTSNLAGTGRYRNRDPIDITKVTLEGYSGVVIKYKG